MPKVIAPRRSNKNVSVEEYWSTREQFSKQRQAKMVVYREEEVSQRYRYARLSQQVLTFNPLLHFLNKQSEPATMDKTHTHEYLESIYYRLPEDIMEVKGMMFGLASILQNIHKINTVIWDHLQYEDSWRLLQTLLSDTRQESYEGWLKVGLGKIVATIDTNFHETNFRKVFNTLCIFMEVCFPKIVESLESLVALLTVLTEHYFCHPNKYIRKFTLKATSYLLSNIEDQQFYSLLTFIVSEVGSKLQPFISDILSNRITYSQGCLTPNSIEELKSMIAWLSSDERQISEQIIEQFLCKFFSNLEIQSSKEERELLFDFGDIFKALVERVRLDKLSGAAVIKAVVSFLEEELPKGRRRQLTPELVESVSTFLWSVLPQLPHDQSIYSLLALSLSHPLTDLANIKAFLEEEQEISFLNILLSKLEEKLPSKDTIGILVFSLRKWIGHFCTSPIDQIRESNIELVYRLTLILKQQKMNVNFAKIVEVDYDIFIRRIDEAINSVGSPALLYQYAITLMRLLTVVKGEEQDQNRVLASVGKLGTSLLSTYSQSITKQFNRIQKGQTKRIFACESHIEELFIYSHSEIAFVLQGINLLESFMDFHKQRSTEGVSLLFGQQQLKNWQKVVLNRASLCSQVNEMIDNDAQKVQNLIVSLKSRHRAVRLETLAYLTKKGVFDSNKKIGELLTKIDSDVIDLENEREVKKNIAELEKQVRSTQLSRALNELLTCWSLGFAFTGFKLIENNFAHFFTTFIETQDDLCCDTIMNFLEYYTFRNSRIFEIQTQGFFASVQKIELPETFKRLCRNDFRIEALETAEFIGIDRISNAISGSEKIKKKLGDRLKSLISVYFSDEFVRDKESLKSGLHSYINEEGEINQLLLPPKTTFLKQIIKLLPKGYSPPLECIHFCNEVLSSGSFAQTKRQEWELMWDKKTKKEQTTIKYEEMSMPEKQIYLHFLWGHTLRADANRIRVILEHIRETLPEMVEYFMNIYYTELALGVTDSKQVEMIFKNMDSRKLLTFIYILKAVIKTLKNYVRQDIQKINLLIIRIIHVFEAQEEAESGKMVDEKEVEVQVQVEVEVEQENGEASDQSSEEEEKNDRTQAYKKYKNHRKELYKVLNTLIEFTADHIEHTTISEIMKAFATQGKISALPNAAISSTPGLLTFLKQLSYHWKFHPLFQEYNILEQLSKIIHDGHFQNRNNSVSACVEILKNFLGILDEGEMLDEGEWINDNIASAKEVSYSFLESFRHLLATLGKKDAIRPELQAHIFKIILLLMQVAEKGVPADWDQYLWTELQRITRQKNTTEKQNEKLKVLIEICMEFSRKTKRVSLEKSNEFLLKMIAIIPHLKDVDHRRLISQELIRDSEEEGSLIGKSAAEIVTSINTTVLGSLSKELDFPSFFDGITTYEKRAVGFTTEEHEYIIYNTLPYLINNELSVRKAVNRCVNEFLKQMEETEKNLVAKLFRALVQYLKKPIEGGEQIFWSVGACVGTFVRWVVFKDQRENKEHYQIFHNYVKEEEGSDQDVFELLCALSQAKKLEGLKMLKEMLGRESTVIKSQLGDRYPNIIGAMVLPMLEHFILPQPVAPGTQYAMTSNLASSLSHVSLEVYEVAMVRGGQSLQKRQLKRLVTKIKFSDIHLKKNILIVKIIGQIIESINLPKSTDAVKRTIEESGFDEFHKKILEKESNFSRMKHFDEESDSEEEAKRVAFIRINHDVEDEEVINMNYLNFDKKMLQAEEAHEKKEESDIIRFLKLNVLAPLKTMLMYENRSEKNSKEETDKSRMFLSVVVTKMIVKFPLDVFLSEMQKVLSKLGRLLKKKQVEVRENSRKCLAEIGKLVGPEMLYMLIRELKFHLRDNFQQHIMNYTIYYILEKNGAMAPGALDHCLPVLLPPIVDEIFGQSAVEKEMVDEHSIKTINMESKKKKGYDLLVILCKQISVSKVGYLVQYFQKFLREYMNTEANLAKYDQLLTSIIGGFSRNEELLQASNALPFSELLHSSIEVLKADIKIYKFDGEALKHETTVKQKNEVGKKVSLKDTYELQEEAGRNGSIFKKQTKVLQERRNHDIMVNSFMQLHLSLLGLLIKRKVFSEESIEGDAKIQGQFSAVTNFVIECIEHRDNRLVHKCLKIIHTVIHWEKLTGIAQMRKKVCRKIFALIEKLTSTDEDLLRECFTLLNDLFVQVTITKEVLPTLLGIIKLHITGSEHGMLEEPYRLFKTVLHKVSGTPLVHEDSILELYELVRITMINTPLDQIRAICKSICLIFIRQEAPQPDAHSKRLGLTADQEVSFYLNNLDCKYTESQLCILDILDEYTISHSKRELEKTGEVIIMSIGTAYANDSENKLKFMKLIEHIVKKIDRGKTTSLAGKCLVWMANPENQLISRCGYFLLLSIASVATDTPLPKNILDGCIKNCLTTLQAQAQKLQIFYSDRRQNMTQRDSLKKNPQWAGIIETDNVHLEVDPNLDCCIDILHLLLPNTDSKSTGKVISLLWRLAAAPEQSVYSKVVRLLLKVKKVAPSVGQQLMSHEKEESQSMKKKISDLMSAVDPDDAQLVCQLLEKVCLQVSLHEQFMPSLVSWVGALVIKIGRCILNLKKFQKPMVVGLEILKHLLALSPESQSHLLADEKVLNDLFWNLCKISRNELIQMHIKEKNEEVMDIIKQKMGESEFYSKLATTEANRKEKKNEDKVSMARLAIIDQAAFEQAKARKKHKKG